eukprot:UN03080
MELKQEQALLQQRYVLLEQQYNAEINDYTNKLDRLDKDSKEHRNAAKTRTREVTQISQEKLKVQQENVELNAQLLKAKDEIFFTSTTS